MSFRQPDTSMPHSFCSTIQPRKIYSIHTPYHLAPSVRFNGFIQPQAFNRLTDKRTGHTLPLQTDACIIIQIIQTVIIPPEFPIGRPDVCGLPIVNGIKIIHIVRNLGAPLVFMVKLLLHPSINRTPAIITFLCADTYQTGRTYCLFFSCNHAAKRNWNS